MKVGVIGAGTMGAGIAQAFAQFETNEVFLSDISLENANRGKDAILKGLSKRVAKGKLEQDVADAITNRINATTTDKLGDCDLIVEAVIEDLKVKEETFKKLAEICREDCIFATNTSSKSVTALEAAVGRPVIGMHFFNPATIMKLVEIIPGLNTPTELVDKIVKITEELGKTPVVVKDGAGFVVNRVLIPMINEAIGIYAEGLADAKGIDTAMKLGANHPMGPLELADLIGLDVCLAIMETLQSEFGDSKYRPHPLLRKMVRGKKLGRKTGEGFYNYKK